MIDIAFKSLAGALLIAAILLLARSDRTHIAGVLVLFPVITLLSYYFIGQSEGPDRLREVVRSSVGAFPIWLIFMGTVYVTLPGMDYRLALAIGTTVWLAVAVAFLSFVKL